MVIQSKHNEKYKAWIKLKHVKGRQATGLFIVEGKHLVEEAIKAQWAVVLLIREGSVYSSSLEQYCLSETLFDALCSTVSKDTLLAVCAKKVFEVEGEHILVCDDIQDPGNMGTMLRTAYSFGFNRIYCSKNCVDIYNDKVIRASQGALFYLDVKQDIQTADLQSLKETGYTIYASGFAQSIALGEAVKQARLAIIVGNEGQGVRQDWLELSHAILNIETTAFNSLNVGIATGIFLHHFR